ncbi:DUF4433 domain-containing protein [Nocardioides psychrotolerans]|nr:DUF4433 domain-containing protein [Nocardioides psychrotolerans]
MAFNIDRRVALLGPHANDLVEETAEMLWRDHPGTGSTDFLDLWLNAVTATAQRVQAAAQRAEVESKRLRQAAAAALENDRRAKEAALRQLHEEAERERYAEQARQEDRDRRRAVEVRARIGYLYNITSIKNLKSIVSRGILCHDEAAKIDHDDVSDLGVQEHREDLHRFASLYFNPRNAMLIRLHKWEHRELVVLRVSPAVLDLPGVLVSDGNAASSRSQRWSGLEGLAHIDLDRIYARSWTTPNGDVHEEAKRIMQAEVLVPRSIPPRCVMGVRAPSRRILHEARQAAPQWPGEVDGTLFFED